MSDQNDLFYGILMHRDPDVLSRVVSTLMREGWLLHGELKLQIMADASSPTLTSVIYIQAMRRELQ